MDKISCCYGCQKRYVGCHAECEEYIRQRTELTAKREKEKEERMKIVEMNHYEVNKHIKAKNKLGK